MAMWEVKDYIKMCNNSKCVLIKGSQTPCTIMECSVAKCERHRELAKKRNLTPKGTVAERKIDYVDIRKSIDTDKVMRVGKIILMGKHSDSVTESVLGDIRANLHGDKKIIVDEIPDDN